VSDVEIIVAPYAGYCYGVERALRLAQEASGEVPTPIRTLGPIIHNPSVVARLARRGIEAVESLDEVGEGTVIIRTHGVAPEVIAEARRRGLEVVDATCPFVTVAQCKASELRDRGYIPVILGERDHPEVAGLTACAGDKAIVLEDAGELPEAKVRGRRVGIVVQTTQTRENLTRLAAALAPLTRELLVFNTICDATEKRQAAARELAARVDAMVIVGGRNSANTTRLARLCSELQPHTAHIESARELDRAWFADSRRIGVAAGASTPEEEIAATVARIRELLAG
jgi:4-hydroxy-3-methylbut-2-enyl diphosphate reductase